MAEPAKRFILNAEQRVYVREVLGPRGLDFQRPVLRQETVRKSRQILQYHHHRVKDEVLYVESGKILLTYGWDEDITTAAQLTLTPDMAFHVLPGMWHKFQALEEAVLTEFSTHHSDKDVVRAGQDSGTEAANAGNDADDSADPDYAAFRASDRRAPGSYQRDERS
jgi:mannose-6-phosphate isomerase-like protein (cupin superfamily)